MSTEESRVGSPRAAGERTITMVHARRRLGSVWFTSAGVLFVVMVGMSIFGAFSERVLDAWSWFLPTVLPTLSLILSAFAAELWPQADKKWLARRISRFHFSLAHNLSLAYLAMALFLLLVWPLTPFEGPLDLMTTSNIWMGPFQGLVAAAIGWFFQQPETAS